MPRGSSGCAARASRTAELARIHGPVGLSIGAVSPAEIAISVMAQITQVAPAGRRRMKFGVIPAAEADGAILAHTLRVGAATFKKGRVLTAADVAALAAAGIVSVTAARLDAGDVPEDQAAATIAAAVGGDGLVVSAAFTGRVQPVRRASAALRSSTRRGWTD